MGIEERLGRRIDLQEVKQDGKQEALGSNSLAQNRASCRA